MLCVLILHMRDVTYSPKSTPNNSFLRSFSWQFLFIHRIFITNLRKESRRRNIFSYFHFVVWPLGPELPVFFLLKKVFISGKETFFTKRRLVLYKNTKMLVFLMPRSNKIHNILFKNVINSCSYYWIHLKKIQFNFFKKKNLFCWKTNLKNIWKTWQMAIPPLLLSNRVGIKIMKSLSVMRIIFSLPSNVAIIECCSYLLI